MNRVAVNAEEIPLPCWSGALGDFALKVLDRLNLNNWELSILLCGDNTIKALNTQYRNKPEATDVLSFELGVEAEFNDGVRYLPGDIVISLDTLKKNSIYFNTPEDEELKRLLIHGILHLHGMDHPASKGRDSKIENDPMILLQEKILASMTEEPLLPKEDRSSPKQGVRPRVPRRHAPVEFQNGQKK